ncbi:hypothetical protein CI109_105682 [Kwoniella shandongensis]|uniref:Uncharacterized protein n=1 Tax=Kwoniella shandongensis TaxID=1734106 RepID=A0A5M6C1K1_9TREE|nr:uncharacterized protein CI109_003022 [Kwoniella shandongensis]KAA5528490.1 hypothetical protein CI109_003022 [Kwoniella shandongensis]
MSPTKSVSQSRYNRDDFLVEAPPSAASSSSSSSRQSESSPSISTFPLRSQTLTSKTTDASDPSSSTPPPRRPALTSSHSSPSLTPFTASSPTKSMKRAWQPSTPTKRALIGSVESRKKGEGRVDCGMGLGGRGAEGAERGLSELYVSHERAEAESALATTGKKQEAKKGWGGTVLSSAVTAGVYGAALGLTAYRLLSNKPDPAQGEETAPPANDQNDQAESPSEVFTETDGDSEHTSRDLVMSSHSPSEALPLSPRENGLDPDRELQVETQTFIATTETALIEVSPLAPEPAPSLSVELLPPPAYEETEGKKKDLKDDWEELDEEVVTPSSSKASTLRLNPFPSPARSSPASRRKKAKRTRTVQGRLHQSASSARSSPVHAIEDDLFSGATWTPTTSLTNDTATLSPRKPAKSEAGMTSFINLENEDDEEDEDDDMTLRLDTMAVRLKELILEGQRALEIEPVRQPEAAEGSDNWSASISGVVTPIKSGHSTPAVNGRHEKAGSAGEVSVSERRRSRIPVRSGSVTIGLNMV